MVGAHRPGRQVMPLCVNARAWRSFRPGAGTTARCQRQSGPPVGESPLSGRGAGCLVLAQAQPQWGPQWQDVPRRGRDLMILLDVSRSMLAEDVFPNRLARAKLDIKNVVQAIRQEGGHRIGLIAFAGRASLQCPLTLDYAFFLEQLNTVTPHTVGRGGTLIGDAIRQALQSFATLAQIIKTLYLSQMVKIMTAFPLKPPKRQQHSR